MREKGRIDGWSLMDFAACLRDRRQEGGLSFRSLSARSQVDVAYLHRLESGLAARPGRNIVIRIAIGLGLNLQETDDLLIIAGHLPLANSRLHSSEAEQASSIA